jgi:hypothetical protein
MDQSRVEPVPEQRLPKSITEGSLGILGRIRCIFGKHDRSQGRAREVNGVYVSVCRHCGVRMRQGQRRKWYVDPA